MAPATLGVVRERKGVQKNVGIATLGNLCVDVVLDVPSLPPASTAEHRAYMERWRLLLRIRLVERELFFFCSFFPSVICFQFVPLSALLASVNVV